MLKLNRTVNLSLFQHHMKMDFLKKFTGSSNFVVGGSVAPGFEPVRELFEDYFQRGLESRAQLCVYLNQEIVVG